MTCARERLMNQRGQSTVEFVLLVPLLLTLFFLIFEFGRVFGSWLLITNSAREGARYGVTQTFNSSADSNIMTVASNRARFLSVQQVACQNNQGQPPTGSTSCIYVSRSTDSSTGDDMLSVLVAYQVQTLMPITGNIPYLGRINYPGFITVYGQADMRGEQ
jgi:Flp pilus assembly protein TadG